MPDPVVEIINLRMVYDETVAVDNLNLHIQRGHITGILGPNGAGKTTTIEACEGFRPPQQGSVKVLGLDPYRDGHALRPRVGVMLQSGGAWAGARAGEMLRHMAALYANPLDPIQLSERLGITEFEKTQYRRLSGGQQQRLNLAIALVGRPELIFLDEPTAGLDPHARHATWELLDELRTHGVSAVLTTHFLDEAEHLCDQIHVLDHGRLVASGSPAELGTDQHGPMQVTVDREIDVAALGAALPEVVRIEASSAHHLQLWDAADPETIALLTRWLADRETLITALSSHAQSLEARYLEMTQRGEL